MYISINLIKVNIGVYFLDRQKTLLNIFHNSYLLCVILSLQKIIKTFQFLNSITKISFSYRRVFQQAAGIALEPCGSFILIKQTSYGNIEKDAIAPQTAL